MKAKTVTTRCWAEASPSAPAPAVAPTAKPRRLSPFGSISLRETALAGHRPHRGRCFAVPVTAAPRRGPNGKTPAPFACFLNTKKVTPSADFGISPRFRGGLPFFPQAAFYSSAPRLFAPSGTASSHSRLAFSLHRSNTRPPPSQKRNRARARLHSRMVRVMPSVRGARSGCASRAAKDASSRYLPCRSTSLRDDASTMRTPR